MAEQWVMQLVDSTDKMMMITKLMSTGQITESRFYLRAYDPDGRDGRGDIFLTDNPKEAMRFDSSGEVLEMWKLQSRVRPLRPDGKPNRPLTAYTASPVRLSEATDGS